MTDYIDYADLYERTKNAPSNSAMSYIVLDSLYVEDIENDGFPTQIYDGARHRDNVTRKMGLFIKINPIHMARIKGVVQSTKEELLFNHNGRVFKLDFSKRTATLTYERFLDGLVVRVKTSHYDILEKGIPTKRNISKAGLTEGVFIDFLYKMNSDLGAYGDKKFSVTPRLIFPLCMVAPFVEFIDILHKNLVEDKTISSGYMENVYLFGSYGPALNIDKNVETLGPVNRVNFTPASITHNFIPKPGGGGSKLSSPTVVSTGIAPLLYLTSTAKGSEITYLEIHPNMRPVLSLIGNERLNTYLGLFSSRRIDGRYRQLVKTNPISSLNQKYKIPIMDMNERIMSSSIGDDPELNLFHYYNNFLSKVDNFYISSLPHELALAGILVDTQVAGLSVSKSDMVEAAGLLNIHQHSYMDAILTINSLRVVKNDSKLMIVSDSLLNTGLLPLSALRVVIQAAFLAVKKKSEQGIVKLVSINDRNEIIEEIDTIYCVPLEVTFRKREKSNQGDKSSYLVSNPNKILYLPDTRFPLFSISEQGGIFMLNIQKLVPTRLGYILSADES